jgi:hypothetical protein
LEEKPVTQANTKKDTTPSPSQSQVRLVVEVDGNPVGFLNLDLERLWPLINHSGKGNVPVDWMEPAEFDSMMRAVVLKRLMARIQGRLYQTLGDEMVKAELDVENFALKADAAAQVFGRTKSELERFVGDSGRTTKDFYTFFWEYMLEDREINDLKKEWKAKDTQPR